MKRWIIILLLLAGVSVQSQTPAAEKTFKYRFGGTYRNLLTSSHSYFTGDAYGDDLNRLRLNLDAVWRSTLQVHVEYDNQVHCGNLITEPDFDFQRQRQADSYLDLLHAVIDEKHGYWDTSLYRGTITFRHGSNELVAGRQRIAWGTAHFWSPADVFNPINPLQVEEDEREGVDAAQLNLRLGSNVRSSVVYAPQDGIDRSTEAGRVSTTIHNFDVSALGGRFAKDWLAGADFAGQWRGAGLRGEFTYTARGTSAQLDALRMTFGSDYAINNKWYVIGEYFYNQGQPPGYFPGQPLNTAVLLENSKEIYTIQRHFLSAGARYSVTPLLNVQTYAVVDLAGRGVLLLPMATYNVTTNSDLSIGGQLFRSSSTGEFNRAPNLFYLEFTVHFQARTH